MTIKQLGFLVETTEGITDIVAGSTLTRFGIENYDRPHPWHKHVMTPSYGVQLIPRAYELGIKELKFDIVTDFVHPAMFKYACGAVDAGGDVFTFLNPLTDVATNPSSIKSFSVYSRLGDDKVISSGCKVEKLNLDIVMNKYVKQKASIVGWESTDGAVTLSSAPSMPASITDDSPKGYTEVTSKEYNDVAQPNIKEIHLEISNLLKVHGGLGSTVPRGIEQMEGSAVKIGILGSLDFTTNDIVSKVKDILNFTEGATNDLEFTLESYEFDIHNVMWGDPVLTVRKGDMQEFAVVGMVLNDNTNEPFTLTSSDGADYSGI